MRVEEFGHIEKPEGGRRSRVESRRTANGWGSLLIGVGGEGVARLVGEGAVGLHDDGDDKFIDGGGVGEVAVTIEKFLQSRDEVVRDFALGFEFGFKDDVFPFAIANGGLWSLEEEIYEDAKPFTRFVSGLGIHWASRCCSKFLMMRE